MKKHTLLTVVISIDLIFPKFCDQKYQKCCITFTYFHVKNTSYKPWNIKSFFGERVAISAAKISD